jgi:acyl-CoA thioester hydrolase
MFKVPIQIQWLHLDPNNHVRHSAYYDFGAYARISLFSSIGLDMQTMKKLHIGPVLFREEAIFKREILFGDDIECVISLYKATKNFNRWGFKHELVKKDGTLAAVIYADGAWLNMELRKLTDLPTESFEKFNEIGKDNSFAWIEKLNNIK